jgi:putative flippase GtrA
LTSIDAIGRWGFVASARLHLPRFLRYLVVGLAATGLSVAVLILLYDVLHLFDEVASNVLAGVAGIGPSYALNRRWVWGRTSRSHFGREVVPFWLTSLAALVLAVLVAVVARLAGDDLGLGRGMRTVMLVGLNVVAVCAIVVGKYWVFNRIFREGTDEG